MWTIKTKGFKLQTASGFPPSRKDVVNGRHAIRGALNVRKPHVQRNSNIPRSLTNAAGDAMHSAMELRPKSRILPNANFLLIWRLRFFWKPHQNAVFGVEYLFSKAVVFQDVWSIYRFWSSNKNLDPCSPRGPKHHRLHQTWRGQQKGWIGHLKWWLDRTGPRKSEVRNVVTSSELCEHKCFGETCQMWWHIEGPNLLDVKPTQVQNMIEKKLDQSTLHLNKPWPRGAKHRIYKDRSSISFIHRVFLLKRKKMQGKFYQDFLRLPGSACRWNDLTWPCTWILRCIQNFVIFGKCWGKTHKTEW